MVFLFSTVLIPFVGTHMCVCVCVCTYVCMYIYMYVTHQFNHHESTGES